MQVQDMGKIFHPYIQDSSRIADGGLSPHHASANARPAIAHYSTQN
jgi:hypothetical protein